MEEIGVFGSEYAAVNWCSERNLSPYYYTIQYIGDNQFKLFVDRGALNGEERLYGMFQER